MGTVYLIHLESKLHHAQHYIGFALFPELRFWHHQQGTGARFLAACNEAGISYRIVRTWENADKHFERKLKNYKKAARFCPVCNPTAPGVSI
jgi:predicted GIY-YIG superfamily endonuclease